MRLGFFSDAPATCTSSSVGRLFIFIAHFYIGILFSHTKSQAFIREEINRHSCRYYEFFSPATYQLWLRYIFPCRHFLFFFFFNQIYASFFFFFNALWVSCLFKKQSLLVLLNLILLFLLSCPLSSLSNGAKAGSRGSEKGGSPWILRLRSLLLVFSLLT